MDSARLSRRLDSGISTFRLLTATIAAIVLLTSCCSLWSQAANRTPVVGKSLRYCNPLPLETSSKDGSPQGVSLGDVTVVRDGNLYYMFGTGGGAWVSSDLVNWKYQAVEIKGSYQFDNKHRVMTPCS